MIWHEKLRASLLDSLTDDALRSRLQFLWVYRILMIVSLGMTLVNVLTGRAVLSWVTFAFGLLCGINTAARCATGRNTRLWTNSERKEKKPPRHIAFAIPRS